MNRIRKLREEKGMTQVRLSIELEVAQETISAYENGKHYPSIQNIIKMMKIFDASIDYIMGFSDVRIPVANFSESEQRFLVDYRKLSPHKKELVLAYLRGLMEE